MRPSRSGLEQHNSQYQIEALLATITNHINYDPALTVGLDMNSLSDLYAIITLLGREKEVSDILKESYALSAGEKEARGRIQYNKGRTY